MKNDTDPHKLELCIMLARGDHAAGVLLHKIHYWSQYSTAKIPGIEGVWRAKERAWWMREAQLSSGQYDRAIAHLAKHELVEKCQYWFGGLNILHVRPSNKTRNFLASATTWDVALEVLAQMGVPCPPWQTHAGTKITPSLQEMISAWGAPSLTPEEVGKLATFRQGLKSVLYKEASYDCSESSLELIAWTVENWTAFHKSAGSYKSTPQPQIEFFCENYGIAIKLFLEAEKMKLEPAELG